MSDIEVQEFEEDLRNREAEARMEADGIPTTERRQQSYFGFAETHRCFLPDGASYVEHQTLNEGARKRYQNAVNREVAIKRSSGDAVMKMAAGDEKHELLRAAIIGWNLVDENGQPIPFTKGPEAGGRVTRPGTLERFLNEAPPKIIDIIDKDIRKHNPWLMAEMTVADMEEQIAEIQEMIEVKKQEDEGKAS